jgi:hypothetical protein
MVVSAESEFRRQVSSWDSPSGWGIQLAMAIESDPVLRGMLWRRNDQKNENIIFIRYLYYLVGVLTISGL